MPAKMKLSSVYSTLPPAERKVADFILANPDEATHMVINEIAHHAGVSVPSVTRLARKLGYSGFMDFRVSLASGSSAVSREGVRPISHDDSDEDLLTKVMLGHITAIESTLKVLDIKKLAEVAELILSSNRVVWFGVGRCAQLAVNVSDSLCRMGIDSIVIDNREIMPFYATRMGKGDLVFCLTRTGKTAKTLECLHIAKEKGATCVLISNLVTSPGEADADYFFCTSRQDDLYRQFGYETGTAMCALLESLTIVIGTKKKKEENIKFPVTVEQLLK